ncbi:MAG: hypothetical protein LC135_17320 [Phycisphaerae bacterium]|nr:hypothetical protein [Phycisphaerae bacterium]MCZ2401601.1 hypothetical protein [Phycisphaerae bacterium]
MANRERQTATRGGIGSRRAAAAAMALLACCAGCVSAGQRLTLAERRVMEAARPLLTLDAGANWTDCYNRLVELGPGAIDFLCRQPALTRPAAPDDLAAALHASLVRSLASPMTRPRLTLSAFETSFDLLHFDPKVRGYRLGTVAILEDAPPRTWPALYPADFDHELAAEVDVERDRQAILAWYRQHAGAPALLAHGRRMRPWTDELWNTLSERPADVWTYGLEPGREVLRAARPGAPPQRWPQATLLAAPSQDYNLTRAACIWLGSRRDWLVQERLIGLVGSSSEVVSYNARFALGFSPDERIRALLRRERETAPPRLEEFLVRGPCAGPGIRFATGQGPRSPS